MKGSNEQGACVGLELRDLVRSPGGEVGGVAQTAEKRGRLPQAGRSEVLRLLRWGALTRAAAPPRTAFSREPRKWSSCCRKAVGNSTN